MNNMVSVGQLDRRAYIGSSDIAGILGLSPWRTPLQVWESKVSQTQEPITPEKAAIFARGHRWEPVAREMLIDVLSEKYNEVRVDGTNVRYADPRYPFMAAEIDCELMIDGEHDATNVEIKTVHAFKAHEWGEEGSDEVPVHYAAQAMYGLMVTGRNRCIVAALFGADSLVTYEIERDEETIVGMRQKAIDFWQNHVLAGKPPEPSNMQDMLRLFAKTNGRPVEADTATAQALLDLGRIRSSIKAMEGEAEELQFKICEYVTRAWAAQGLDAEQQAKDDAVLTIGGEQIASWKKQRGTYLDQKRLKFDHPEIVNEYTKEHWFRSIRIKRLKD